MKTFDLNPCPKCGSLDVFAVRTATLPSDFRIKCNHCGIRGEWFYSWEGAVLDWNMTLRLTKRHIEDMKHCIGMDYKKPYKRHGKLFYRPWRNFYATGPDCDGVDIWIDLERQGCAERKRHCNWTFALTRKGLDVLGMQLNVQIYDE